MLNASLPGLEKKTLDFPWFPTRQQLIVWRNWGLVPVVRIAKVLDTSEENITQMAYDMGLTTPVDVDENWLRRGYITIIRANWHILSYRQLLILLEWSEEKLANTIKEDDFLYVKVGNFKPDIEEVLYKPLTAEQKERTREIRKIVEGHFSNICDEAAAKPFGFLEEFEVRTPELKSYGKVKPDEVMLDSQWSIVIPENTRYAEVFVQRFAANHESKWGIKLGCSNNKVAGKNTGENTGEATVEEADKNAEGIGKIRTNCKNLLLEIRPEAGKLSESHSIEVTESRIYIRAVDEVGLLRGLQWMEKSMDSREGPFLKKGLVNRETRFDTRIVHAYSAVFGDPLLETDMDPYPEGLLAKLSDIGVNGIWLQGVLYTLVPWEEEPSLSVNWEKRLDGLRNLINKAAGYGIGVYLYINEPRAMSKAFFEKHPDWKGQEEGDYAALCTSVKPVQEYLKNGVRRLFEEAPDLAGIITITMSENLTNCYSRTFQETTSCPRCSVREPQEIVAEVNRLIAEGAHNVKPDAKVICWTWGWQNPCGREQQWIKDTVQLLPDNVRVMCTSEEAVDTEIAGIKGSVLDYSMSVAGPGERALGNWTLAADKGMKTMAKVQLNNTWECSAVPYIPVPGLVAQHLKRLTDAGVSGLMLGWTLGGYPSLNLEIASQFYWKQEHLDADNLAGLAVKSFGDEAGKTVYEAWELFGKAFKEFPFDIGVLYTAPQNFGPKNLLFKKPTGFKATMIGFPYDDLESWRGIYPEEIFEEQFRRLSEEWLKGLDKLSEAEKGLEGQPLKVLEELKDVAEAVYCHFRSTYLQIAFVRLRNLLNNSKESQKQIGAKDKIMGILKEETELAKKLYIIAARDPRTGYEASNNYYYTPQELIEKAICCEYLMGE